MNPSAEKKLLSPLQLLMISFAAIFGSGWLFAPFFAAKMLGPAALLAWIVGALLSAIMALALAEVITLFPKTGGLTLIAKTTHGEFLALTLSLFQLVVYVILPTLEVRASLQYLSPHFLFLNPAHHPVTHHFAAFAALALITLVHRYGVHLTAQLNQGLVLFKLITPLVLIAVFWVTLAHPPGGGGLLPALQRLRLSALWPSAATSSAATLFHAITASGILFSFNGFNQAALFAAEVRNPQKALPFALFGSLLLAALLYLMIQLVFLLAALPLATTQDWSALAFPGDQAPFVGLAQALELPQLLGLIYLDAVISPLGTAFNYAGATPRLLSATLQQTPHGSAKKLIACVLALECLAYALLPSLTTMITLLVAAFVICYTVAPASLLALRMTLPDAPRPFRVRGAPAICFVALMISNLMVLSCGKAALWPLLQLFILWSLFYGVLKIKQHQRCLKPLLQALGSKEALRQSWFALQLAALTALSCYRERDPLSLPPLSFQASVACVAAISFVALLISQIGLQAGDGRTFPERTV